MEGEAAARAALMRTTDQMHPSLCRERFEQALADGSDAVEEDVAFHDAVAQACGNRFFSMTMNALAPQTREFDSHAASWCKERLDRRVPGEHAAVAWPSSSRTPPPRGRPWRRRGIARLFGH